MRLAAKTLQAWLCWTSPSLPRQSERKAHARADDERKKAAKSQMRYSHNAHKHTRVCVRVRTRVRACVRMLSRVRVCVCVCHVFRGSRRYSLIITHNQDVTCKDVGCAPVGASSL